MLQREGERKRDLPPLAGAECIKTTARGKLEEKETAFSRASGLAWDLCTRSPGLREIMEIATNCREE